VSADAIKLDSLVVASSRETHREAIAINEQRFAPNIKNVVAADRSATSWTGMRVSS
jgi:hypothetical protein